MSSTAAKNCFHCGEPVPAGLDLDAEIDGIAQPMCCPGCQAVARLIDAGGMTSFYRLRTAYSPRPESDDAANPYTIYDTPENREGFCTSPEPGTLRAQLLLGGVSCAACTWLIETVLKRLPGIVDANVNLARQSLSVSLDLTRISLSEIFQQLAQLGYEPHPWQAQHGAGLMQSEQRAALRELAVAGLAMMQVGMFAIALHAGEIQGIASEYRGLLRWVSLIIATVVVGYCARSFFRNAWAGLRHSRLVMDVPVALAIGLAYAASAWATVSNSGQVYFDSIAMFTFFLLLGRFLERRVRQRELLRQTDLQSLLPASCLRKQGDNWETVATRSVRRGDTVLLKAGEVIPADGLITRGQGSVDEAAFTGEHFPRAVAAGITVSAGTLFSEGSAELSVSADASATRLAHMLDLVEQAMNRKPPLAQLADRVAAVFVGAVLLLAASVAGFWLWYAPERALWITLSVLVVSCPCALALATPAALTSATAALRRNGVLLVGDGVLEAMNHCRHIVFDKTGTLTRGELRRLQVVTCAELDEGSCLQLAAGLEQHSNHPIAAAFSDVDGPRPFQRVENIPGQGMLGWSDNKHYALGNVSFVRQFNQQPGIVPPGDGHWLALSRRDRVLAWIALEDTVRSEAAAVIEDFRSRGFRVELLTGDHSEQGARLGRELGMDKVMTGCSPERKLEYILDLQRGGAQLAMVGDGLNDAPVLAAADCSFAVNRATDLAKSRADAIMLNPSLEALPRAFDSARQCQRVIKQNMGWALAYNLTALPLAAAGMVPPWAAAIGMSASSLLVVLNSLRIK